MASGCSIISFLRPMFEGFRGQFNHFLWVQFEYGLGLETPRQISRAQPSPVLQGNVLRGVARECSKLRSHKRAILTKPNYQRTSIAGSDNLTRVIAMDHSNAPRSFKPSKSSLYGIHERHAFFQIDTNQIGDHYSISLRIERNAFLHFFFHLCIIFNCAIVHQCDPIFPIRVRVSICVSFLHALPIANVQFQWYLLCERGAFCLSKSIESDVEPLLKFGSEQLTIRVNSGDAHGIITPILQNMQSFEQKSTAFSSPIYSLRSHKHLPCAYSTPMIRT